MAIPKFLICGLMLAGIIKQLRCNNIINSIRTFKIIEMQNTYRYNIKNPDFSRLGYIAVVANVEDKHDRSAPSDYHWKILKCRMIIFSNSSILACPDKRDVKQVHIIFNKLGDDYDKLNWLFVKFSLCQEGVIRAVTEEIFLICFEFTLIAKLAPVWNLLGQNYFINNRDFLTTKGLQEGVQCHISTNEQTTVLEVTPIKINLMISCENFLPGDCIRILPSLNKAVVEECVESLPKSGSFKSYKDIRRHWKNIHGYRLPENEGTYYRIRFWRGEPLTYPKICVIRTFPIITPMPTSAQALVAARFISCIKSRISHFLGQPLHLQNEDNIRVNQDKSTGRYVSQAISLCTPTQQ